MSRTPANYSITVVRGSTWEESFDYTDEAGQPIDLTGYEARMQVREIADRFGDSQAPPVLELRTDGVDPLMYWADIENGELRIKARPDQHEALNPANLRKMRYAYSIELFKPDGAGEYVIPLVTGAIRALGEVTR